MDIAYDYSGVYNSLSDDAIRRLDEMGINAADANLLSHLSFEDVMGQLANMAGESFNNPLKGLVTVIAVLILCAMLSAYRSSLSDDIGATVNTAASLCISCALAAPAISYIGGAGGIISHSAKMFLAYVPVVAVMLAASGKGISGAGYHASMIAAGQGVSRVCADLILPFMNVFLGVSITSGISNEVRLNSFLSLISKTVKWLLAFVMTVFTAVLSMRQIAAGAVDSVASRTAKFALSSFVPVVGGALGEAYKSVQSSITLLKSGLGIFVIIAIAVTFLPTVLQGLGWSFCIFIGKAVAEALGIDGCAKLLEAIGTVFSTMIAVLLCVMSVFIIATAAAFTIGGEGS